jgi:spore maturation protein SpmA
MIVGSVLAALILGRIGSLSTGVLEAAEFTVNFLLPQAGFMAFWMGIMRLVEKSGMINTISRVLSPLLRILFPAVPKGHPALGAIAMNLGATMLGASNAATPSGLRAMHHLQTLNPNKHVATNEMCMLLAMSTAAITIIPASTIRALFKVGSTRATEVILPAILTTLIATLFAILMAKLLSQRSVYTPGLDDAALQEEAEKQFAANAAKASDVIVDAKPLSLWLNLVLVLVVLLPIGVGIAYVMDPGMLKALQTKASVAIGSRHLPDASLFENLASTTGFERFVRYLSAVTIPFFIAYFVLHAAFAKVKVFEEFVEGAKDGFNVILRVLPYVVGILVAVRLLRESGLMYLLEQGLRPIMAAISFPESVLPMALIRPLSGGAAQAVLVDVAKEMGPNSMETMIAATINGSADTTFYIVAVYFGSVGIKKLRHALAAGLLADGAVMIAAVWVCKLILK